MFVGMKAYDWQCLKEDKLHKCDTNHENEEMGVLWYLSLQYIILKGNNYVHSIKIK